MSIKPTALAQCADIEGVDVLSRLYPPQSDSCELTVVCRRRDYSASAIARAVEDCDAHLLNLNVTSDRCEGDDMVVVELRVSHRGGAAVGRSLGRYGYEVTDIRGGEPDGGEELLRARVNAMLHELEI